MPEGPEIVIVGAGIAGAAAEATGVLAIPDRGVGIVEVLPRKHPDCLGRCP
jgi:NADPH-dependent 2,4-dienoyl-CoA reductase/sulfur reductase-like enzyme